MSKETFGSVFGSKLAITPEFCAIVGQTAEEIAAMDARQLALILHDKGYEITCHALATPKGRVGKLTMTVESGHLEAPHG